MSASADARSRGIAGAIYRNGKARKNLHACNEELAQATQELETVYAALDNVDSGLLLLSSDLRALYSNPSLHVALVSNP